MSIRMSSRMSCWSSTTMVRTFMELLSDAMVGSSGGLCCVLRRGVVFGLVLGAHRGELVLGPSADLEHGTGELVDRKRLRKETIAPQAPPVVDVGLRGAHRAQHDSDLRGVRLGAD